MRRRKRSNGCRGPAPNRPDGWSERFNAQRLRGLVDLPRPGKPPTYTPEQVGEALLAALTKPKELGLPFGSWTLDRLEAYLKPKLLPFHNLERGF